MQIRFARFSCFRSCAPESTCPSVGSARLASSVCDLVNTLRVRCCVPMANIVSARLVKQDLVISLSAGPSSIFIVNSIMSVVLSINNSCIINTLWVSECRMRTLSYSSIRPHTGARLGLRVPHFSHAYAFFRHASGQRVFNYSSTITNRPYGAQKCPTSLEQSQTTSSRLLFPKITYHDRAKTTR
jgi:hypothetical protein